ncbi:hypothetical protein [Myxococcus landrumensis]|uniref:DUF304 domain-containing protein n=1 Tax=Myxococcus landrumensis TaxID=2813577 RepID=A0ABX7NDS0_9BACT|nr:hypothetical protein [Myxococcus landrumus]QSQ15745.1 hypothetical protein JY572_06700 [Myxococcus landrumus]
MSSPSHPAGWPQWAQAIPPEPDEHVFETGGTYVLAYLFALLFSLPLLITIVVPLVAIWFFWGRSGRFLLTSHRLIWNPHMGKKVIIPREALRGLEIDVGTRMRSVSLRGAQKLTMPLLWRYKKLWGGLLLLQRWQPPSTTSATAAFKVVAGWRVSGLQVQPGAVVILRDSVRFLPEEPSANVAVEGGAAMAGLMLGVTYRSHRAQLPVVSALAQVARAQEPQSELDSLQRLVSGETWQGPPAKQGPAGKGRTRVTYQEGPRKLTFVVPAE